MMDWGKTKTIFILTFLFLNLLLGYQIYMKQSQSINESQWDGSSLDELRQALSQRKIILNATIPKEILEMHFLQVKENQLSEGKTLAKVKMPVENEVIESIAREKIANFEHYELDGVVSTGNHLVYNQIKDGFPYFNAKLEFQINQDGTIQYSQRYFEVMNQGSDRQVVSSYTALRTLLDQQLLPSEAIITKIRLGYHGQTQQTSVQVLTPVWRISYQIEGKRDMIFVNALTGAVEKALTY
ncbi:two-component system regulatory protein YycI [Tepidibacillus infernus]|uniref:two-component system regulatory protein YycI n=1 Tax=Tepidibacillus TaxID=1494427 RepID=UPI0008536EE9|nr:two-component system regulatory protein YycI [Tepidibacillus sp. HK-1]GBF11525.1 two-component system YycFG regulatory protein [Tepidibacillus sp. HK-1]